VAVSDATASAVGGVIYVIGGCDDAKGNSRVGGNETHPFHACIDIADHVMIYRPLQPGWTLSSSKMMMARYRHAAVVVGTDIYVVGGRNVLDQLLTSVLRYSTTDDAWSTVGDFPGATSDNAAFEHGGAVIACGGYNHDYSGAQASCHILELEAEQPAFIPWAASLATGRGDFSIVRLQDAAYAYGGFDSSFTALASIERVRFQGTAGQPAWETMPAAMRHARGDFAAAALHGRLLAIGGESGTNALDAGASLRHVEAFSPQTAAWLGELHLAPIPHATFRFCAAAVRNSVYIFGGQRAFNASCDCYPTHSGVFVYHERATRIADGTVPRTVVLAPWAAALAGAALATQP